MKIVIVEDEAIMAMYLEESLIELGHEVLACFSNANDLFLYLADHEVDLVFMDILINGPMDGIEAGIQLKNKYSNILLIFLTSYNDRETINLARDAKPDGYIIKPITKNDLDAAIMVLHKHDRFKKINNSKTIMLSTYLFDKGTGLISEHGVVIKLSYKEQLCLSFLIKNKNNYVSVDTLLSVIWEEEHTPGLNSLRELIYRLRKKLPNLTLESSPNIGYILTT